MKIYFFILLLLFLPFAISAQRIDADILEGSFIDGAEPKGFRDIPWGTDISDVKDLQSIESEQGEKGVKIYSLTSIEWDGFEFDKISYYFFEGKLFMVILYTKDKNNWEDIERRVFDKYGAGKKGKYS